MRRPLVELRITVAGLAELVEKGNLTIADAESIANNAEQEVRAAVSPFANMNGIVNPQFEYMVFVDRPWSPLKLQEAEFSKQETERLEEEAKMIR
jgi:hypothetical protein